MPGPMGRRNRGPAQKVENSGQVLKRLFGIIFKKYKFQMIIVFVCILISVLANVQGSLFIQNLIDDYITPMIQSGSRDFGPMLGAILRVAIFYAIGAASAFIYAKIMVYVTQGTMRDLRCQIFEHMESLPIKYFDTHPHGDIMSVYTNDIDTLRQMISQSIPQLFNSGITIIAVLVSMFTLSIPLTILTLVMVGVMLFVTKQLASRSGRFFAKQQADLGATNGYIEEMMNGQKVVKVFNHEKKSIEEFNELNDRLFNSSAFKCCSGTRRGWHRLIPCPTDHIRRGRLYQGCFRSGKRKYVFHISAEITTILSKLLDFIFRRKECGKIPMR